MSAQEDIANTIGFGVEVQKFLTGTIGTYLIERAKEDEQEALEGLANVDANDPAAIRRLQAQVWRANSFVGWLQEALEKARAAHDELGEHERLVDQD